MSGTAGAHLRPLTPSDADDVLAAFAGDPSMTRQGDVRTRADAESYIAGVSGEGTPGAFALVLDGEDEQGSGPGVVVGVVGVGPVDADNGIGWFWYWLHREHRGRGLASAAAATVADWALGPRGLHRLELGHRANNPASGVVARAAGFVPEGREREKFLVDGERVDVLTYGRLSTDPVPSTGLLPLSEAT